MTPHDPTWDCHDAALEGLRRLTPNQSRTDRVKARCHAQFDRTRRRKARREMLTSYTWQVLAPAAVGGVCLVYAVLFAAVTFDLQAVFQ